MTGKLPATGPAGIINPTTDVVGFIPDEDVEAEQRPELLSGDATTVVRVAILSPFQVVHERRAYLPGDTAEVPQHVAQRWFRNRWVTVLDPPPVVHDPPPTEAEPGARRGRK